MPEIRPLNPTVPVSGVELYSAPTLKKRSYEFGLPPGVGRTAVAKVVCSHDGLPNAKFRRPTSVYGSDGVAPMRKTQIASLPCCDVVTKH